MADTCVSCPQCGNNIPVPENLGSKTSVSCPHCGSPITVTRVEKASAGEQKGLKWEYRSCRTVATTFKCSHSGGHVDGEGGPPMTRRPGGKALTVNAVFREESQSNRPKSETYRVQGCLPVLLICIGAFVSFCDTAGSDFTTRPTGALLIIAGIVWGIAARRLSAWRKRKAQNCKASRS